MFARSVIYTILASSFFCMTSFAQMKRDDLSVARGGFSKEVLALDGTTELEGPPGWIQKWISPQTDMKFYTALSSLVPEESGALRGAREVQLFRRLSPSVVLVVTNSGLGSGSVLSSSGEILTNWHVIDGATEVGVILKPQQEGKVITKSDVRVARVVKFDQTSDLALLKLKESPANLSPIVFGSMQNDAAVGADVHAIGHPTGESWTYTKGVISQVRRDYKWNSSDKKVHQATVIQTQTPINPGNSGGPLLTDEGKLIGVNSFKSTGEGLNFAVSVEDVEMFLKSTGNRIATKAIPTNQQGSKSPSCPKGGIKVYSGEDKESGNKVVGLDMDCDGKVDVEVRTPFDKAKPISMHFDGNGDGKPDMVTFDFERKGRVDLSFHDVNFDGRWDLVGHHPDGKLEPSRYERYDSFIARL